MQLLNKVRLNQCFPNGGDFNKLGEAIISKGAKGVGDFEILGDFKTLKLILDILEFQMKKSLGNPGLNKCSSDI